jgi:hypothetical protein
MVSTVTVEKIMCNIQDWDLNLPVAIERKPSTMNNYRNGSSERYMRVIINVPAVDID